MNLHSNGLFRETISALRGCCPLKFLHALQIEQGLLAHTTRGTEVPPPKKKHKNINRENLKFCLKFCVLESNGAWGIQGLPKFRGTLIILERVSYGLKFCTHIHRVDRNKSPCKFWGK